MADEVITNLEEAAAVAVETPVLDAEHEAQATEAKAETAVAKVEREIEIWFNDLRGNLQGIETETHNKLFAAKEALKARLTAIL
jgi:hypothetical protein